MGALEGIAEAVPLERPPRVLMVTPDYFEVEYVINPHMEGQVGEVDTQRAIQQWNAVRAAYDNADIEVEIMDGAAGLPDMVFCANQTLPAIDKTDRKVLILSRMASEYRQPEVVHFESFFADRGYELAKLPDQVRFEGCGDAIWHAGRKLLWLGYGFRTDRDAATILEDQIGIPVIPLQLMDDAFYHLDTCLSILDESTALWVPSAFSAASQDRVRSLVPRLLDVPQDEARNALACNAHSPDGESVLIERQCTKTIDLLSRFGYVPVEVDTSEFLKAGGSVFCMKQMFW